MNYCAIYCTTTNKEDAIEISKHLLDKKLIACCNILPNITSVYEWKKELCVENEALLIIKTQYNRYKEVETEIKKIHKYETPEIICVPIKDGSAEYLAWIEEQTNRFPK